MRREIHVCDVCGAEHAEPSGWLVAYIDEHPDTCQPQRLTLQRADTKQQGLLGARVDLCGQACATRKVSEFMGAIA